MPITKTEKQPDGSVIVSGICTNDAVDLDDQIIDLDFSRKGLAEWGATWGNVRQMHSTSLPPAGTAVAVDTTQKDGVHLTARIVEPGAVHLVNEGVYKAFSVGISRPRIVRDMVAKNGRVTDGVFSEVSLVDFPALPSATFSIAKRSKAEVKKVEKMMTRVGVIKKVDESVGGGVDRDTIPDDDFAGPDRTFPIVTPKDVHDASLLVGHADNPDAVKAKIKAIATRKGPKFVAQLPEDSKAVEPDIAKGDAVSCPTCKGDGKIKGGSTDCPSCGASGKVSQEKADELNKAAEADVEKVEGKEDDEVVAEPTEEVVAKPEEAATADAIKTVDISYALRRAHDATCEAYPMDVVKSVHPAVEEGIAAVLDPEVIRIALASTAQDNADPETMIGLAKAYGSAKLLTALPPETVAEARDSLAKAFSDMYPDAHPTPGNVTPGQFQRTYLSSGRPPAVASTHNNSIPTQTAPISAGSFNRDLITDGHEAESPGDKGSTTSGGMSAAAQLKAAGMTQAENQLTELHDHIAAMHPGICALTDAPAAGVEALDTSGSITPVKAAKPKLTKAEKLAKKARKLEKRAKKLEETVEEEEVIATPDNVIKAAVLGESGEVLIDTAVLTDLIKTITAEESDEEVETLKAEVAELTKRLDAYDSEPDPAAAPVRAVVATTRALEKHETETAADRLEKAAKDELAEEVAHLERLAKSGDPELRMRAETQLNKIRDRAAFGEPTVIEK